MGKEHPLQVARCTKIIPKDPALAEAARALIPQGAAAQGQKVPTNKINMSSTHHNSTFCKKQLTSDYDPSIMPARVSRYSRENEEVGLRRS